MTSTAEARVAEIQRWIRDFTTNPHPDLGREGVVCPYMVRALGNAHVTLLAFDADRGDDALAAQAHEFRSLIRQRAAALGAEGTFQVRFAVPYGLPEPELKAMVARVHARLRREFVASGFMVGDFWPEHDTPGLHSPTFRPFASPMPMLGVRQVVPADLVFFITPDIPADVQREYLEVYGNHFAGRLNEYWSKRLAAALAAVDPAASTQPGPPSPA
jgi:hypothetical protein